jgi:cytochrome c biogenesis protein CcdA
VNLVVFAYGAGLLATVNPCGFAMLPAFLGFYIGGDTEAETLSPYNRAAQGVRVGAAVSAGFGAVFTIVGLAVTAGLRQLLSVVPWVAVVLGVAFTIMGAAMIGGRHIGLAAAQRVQVDTHQRSYSRMVAFGAAYAFASLSCTLAVLLSVIAQALATDNLAQLVAVFAAYAAGAATLLMALALSAAFAKQGLTAKVRGILPIATRLGGAVLALSGLYLIAYWLPSLLGSDARNPLAAPVEAASSTISVWLSDNTGLAAFVGAALVVSAATTTATRRLRRRDRHDTPEPSTAAIDVDCCTPPLMATSPTTRPEDPT